MNLMEIMLKRRSVRRYSGEAVPEAALAEILRAGLLAPTGHNRRPCEFYVVRDRETLRLLSKAKASGSGMLAECGAAIVVAADGERSDTWIEDGSIALTYMDLTAASLGIGSCWCQIRLRSSAEGRISEDVVREILALPAKYRVLGILSLGIPETAPIPHTPEEADFSKVRGFEIK